MENLQIIIDQLNIELKSIFDKQNLKLIYEKYLWKTWIIKNEYKKLSILNDDQKKTFWKQLQEINEIIKSLIQKKENEIFEYNLSQEQKNDFIDFSSPFFEIKNWKINPITKTKYIIDNHFIKKWFHCLDSNIFFQNSSNIIENTKSWVLNYKINSKFLIFEKSININSKHLNFFQYWYVLLKKNWIWEMINLIEELLNCTLKKNYSISKSDNIFLNYWFEIKIENKVFMYWWIIKSQFISNFENWQLWVFCLDLKNTTQICLWIDDFDLCLINDLVFLKNL